MTPPIIESSIESAAKMDKELSVVIRSMRANGLNDEEIYAALLAEALRSPIIGIAYIAAYMARAIKKDEMAREETALVE